VIGGGDPGISIVIQGDTEYIEGYHPAAAEVEQECRTGRTAAALSLADTPTVEVIHGH
jgi:hypothetical protein